MERLHEAARIALLRADEWLAEQECDSVVSLCDRLLIRSLHPHGPSSERDLSWLREQAPRLTAVAAAQAEVGELHLDAPALLVPLWAWPKEQSAPLRAVLEPVVAAMIDRSEAIPEPSRSAFLYWCHLAGLAERREPGPHPEDPRAAAYHDTHLVLYATEYGLHPVEASALRPVLARLEAAAEQTYANADLRAEVLLCLLAVRPVEEARLRQLVGRLLRDQRPEGDFGDEGDDFDQRHHATCVAWLALARWLHLG